MATYKEIRQMWSDIGMDLDKHDEFLQSFPSVFKNIILSQKDRPGNMAYYDNIVKTVHGQRPFELYEFKQRGGKVFGTYCVYVPEEIVYALGGVTTGLCGGDQFWVPGGETVLPSNTCPLIKSSMGSRLDCTSPFCQIADMYIGENTCDGKKKAWEILGQYKPMHIMDMPQNKRPKDIVHFAEEIVELISKVEEVTGSKLDSQSLAESIRLINMRRQALLRFHATRRYSPVPISGKDACMVTQVAFYDDPARFTTQVNILTDELEKRIAASEGPFSKDAPRILVTGSPMALPNWKIHHAVETSGGVVVCEELCTGTRYYENLVEESGGDLESQVMSLAQRYMKTNCACFVNNTGRIDDILRLTETYQADGVIDYSLQFCGLYSTESYLVAKALKDKGIPVLHIETDYSSQDTEQLRTRIEAFLELLS